MARAVSQPPWTYSQRFTALVVLDKELQFMNWELQLDQCARTGATSPRLLGRWVHPTCEQVRQTRRRAGLRDEIALVLFLGAIASASLSRPNRRNLMISGGCRKRKDSSTDEVLVGAAAPLGYRLCDRIAIRRRLRAKSEAYAEQGKTDAAEGTRVGEGGSRDPARPPIA
jgi:hypothetical protein